MTLTPYMSRLGLAVDMAYFTVVVIVWKSAAFMAFLLCFWTLLAGFLGQDPLRFAVAFAMLYVTLFLLAKVTEDWIFGTVYAAISCGVLMLSVHELDMVDEYRALRAQGLLEPYGITRIVVPPVPMSPAEERDAANEAVAVITAIAEVLPGDGPVHLSTDLVADALRPFQGPEPRFSVSHDLGLGGFRDVRILTPWGWEITTGVGLAPDMRDDRWDASWIRVAGVSSRACVILAEAFVADPAVAIPFTGDRGHVDGKNIQRGCDANHDHSVTFAYRAARGQAR